MTYEFILTDIKEETGVITISNPEKLNALSPKVFNEFELAFERFEKDNNIKVIIITGAGEKSFVAGADINQFEGKNAIEGRAHVRNMQLRFHKIEQSTKPVIAAINGYCLGGGLEIAMCCDIRYASENALLGQPEIKLGIIPGAGGTQRLPKLIGKGKAKELIFTGNNISAKEALDIQLVQKVTSPEKLMEESLKLARDIAKNSPLIVSMVKDVIDKGFETNIETGLLIEADKFGLCFATQDKKEGVKAFLEKRKPVFVGK
ncbi:MAG: enoyl-CoA hydratase/isomerase family protein [Candidatus Hodarchaeales archaeon]